MDTQAEDIRDALVELDRLRSREVVRRRESEAVLQIVRVLADQSDDPHLPLAMLEMLAVVFGAESAAMVPCAASNDELQVWPEDADFTAWPSLERFDAFSTKRPRLIVNAAHVPDLAGRIAQIGALLIGGLSVGDERVLLVLNVVDNRLPFDQRDLDLFKRVIPLAEQSLLRQRERALRDRLEAELLNAQKMESLGTLAGGIAHEINTPLQYIADNLTFLKGAAADLAAFAETALETQDKALRAAAEEADLEFLRDELPDAFDQTLDGVEKISKIVRAIKEFSHPGGQGMGRMDVNNVLETAVTVTRNQWKYVADLDLDLDPDLPEVRGEADSFRQVVLNLVVNAAQAIEDRIGAGDAARGVIRVASRTEPGGIAVTIADNGAGMTDAVREKAFDLFFTTKEPGRGTGQGLAICHSIVVQKHGGRIDLETEPGKGTTFVLHLPSTQAID